MSGGCGGAFRPRPTGLHPVISSPGQWSASSASEVVGWLQRRSR